MKMTGLVLVLRMGVCGRDMNANGRFICMMKRNGRKNKNERHIFTNDLDVSYKMSWD